MRAARRTWSASSTRSCCGGRRAAHIHNTLALGFEAGLDLRDTRTQLELSHTLFWGNHGRPVAYEENGSNTTTQQDDDMGLDEARWFFEADRRNGVQDPMVGDCFDRERMDVRPRMTVNRSARRPPDDGFFDSQASLPGRVPGPYRRLGQRPLGGLERPLRSGRPHNLPRSFDHTSPMYSCIPALVALSAPGDGSRSLAAKPGSSMV